MKRKNFIPLTLVIITIPSLTILASTSCSSSIKKHITDETRYDSIIKPAPAQTVTTNEQLRELGESYLNDPKKVAGD
jgi:uncharacterized protein YpmS